MIKKAKNFAKAAHNSINHKRKYTGEPYWAHLERVAQIVATVTDNEAVIAAAWLHDVLEDVTPVNPDFNELAIQREFGDHVLQLVLEVTDVSNSQDGNRATRKAIDRAHLAQASNEGKLIKLADLIDNTIDITQNDPGFAKVFRKEVALDLSYLKTGNQTLYLKLNQLLSEIDIESSVNSKDEEK